jgi:hypothetical protein
MLFSSGDSPQSASSNLSGEGFDEVQPGESPFVVFAAKPLRLHTLLMGLSGRSEAGTNDNLSSPEQWIASCAQPTRHGYSGQFLGLLRIVQVCDGDRNFPIEPEGVADKVGS